MRMTSLKTALFAPVLGLLLVSSLLQAQSEVLDRIVAIVDSDVVLQSELDARTQSVMDRLQERESSQPLPPEDVLQKQVLDQLILERLQLQMGERYGIEVTDQDLEEAMGRVLSNNQITQEQLEQELAQEGVSMAAFRQQIYTELSVNQVQQAIVNNRIQLNEQDIDSFLASTDGKFATSPEYRLGHILIAVPGGADSEAVDQVQAKARDIHSQLAEGADFSQIAITHSNDQNALQGGELGWRKLEQLPELFSDPVSELDVGEVTEPVRSGAGFHILKVLETRGSGQPQLVEQTKARHILIKTSEIVDDQAAEEKLREIRQQLLDGGDFSELAREHSEDIGSMLQGGDLGWSSPGQMVPAFDAAMAEAEEGEISEPFKSRFGWHILQVEDRREQDMSEMVLRNQAANMLRSRRFDEELQTWLAEIREEAYIEVKL